MKITEYGKRTIACNFTGKLIWHFEGYPSRKDWPGEPYDIMFIFFLYNGYMLDEFAYKTGYDLAKFPDKYYPLTGIKSLMRRDGYFSGIWYFPSDEKRAMIDKYRIGQ